MELGGGVEISLGNTSFSPSPPSPFPRTSSIFQCCMDYY